MSSVVSPFFGFLGEAQSTVRGRGARTRTGITLDGIGLICSSLDMILMGVPSCNGHVQVLQLGPLSTTE